MNQTRVPAPQLRESLFSHSLGREGLWATQAGVCWPQRRTDWCPLQSPESGLLLIHTQSGLVRSSRLDTTCQAPGPAFPAPPKIGGRDAHSTKPRTDPWSAERNMAIPLFALSPRPFLPSLSCLSVSPRPPLSCTTNSTVSTILPCLHHLVRLVCVCVCVRCTSKHPLSNSTATTNKTGHTSWAPSYQAAYGYGYKTPPVVLPAAETGFEQHEHSQHNIPHTHQ